MENEMYFVVKISTDVTDPESGRTRKVKEEKLVKGFSVTDVEAKVTKKFEGSSLEWRITSVVESKIDEVIE
jgi:hypothetical protein